MVNLEGEIDRKCGLDRTGYCPHKKFCDQLTTAGQLVFCSGIEQLTQQIGEIIKVHYIVRPLANQVSWQDVLVALGEEVMSVDSFDHNPGGPINQLYIRLANVEKDNNGMYTNSAISRNVRSAAKTAWKDLADPYANPEKLNEYNKNIRAEKLFPTLIPIFSGIRQPRSTKCRNSGEAPEAHMKKDFPLSGI